MSLKKVALISLIGLSLAACIDVGDDDEDDDTATGGSGGSGATTSVEASLDAAVEYMDEALPEYGSATATAYFMADTKRSLIAAAQTVSPISTAHAAAAPVTGTDNLATYWATSTDGQLISPAGGYSNNGTETYPNTGELVTLVNVKEYIGQQLDGDFVRESGDGGPYKPTLFGRFENALEIVKIMGQVFPDGPVAGDKQVYAIEDSSTGDITVSETEPAGQSMSVILKVVDISDDSDTYDMAIYVELGGGGSDQGDSNWMWLKNTADTLNFQHMEFKEITETIDSQSVSFDRTSVSTLRWNRTTGEMGFEYVSFDDDDNTQAYGNIMRAYIEETDGDAYMMAFEGDSSGGTDRDTHQIFSIASTGGEDATEALVSVNMDLTSNNQSNGGQDLEVAGKLCASMEDGDAITGCTSLDLGNLDVSTGFPTVVTNLIDIEHIGHILQFIGAATWTDSTAPELGGDLPFTDTTDMHLGYTVTTQ